MGFCYDSYVTRKRTTTRCRDDRNLLLPPTMVLDDEAGPLRLGTSEPFGAIFGLLRNPAILPNCLARRSMSCSSFERDSSGFTATIKRIRTGWSFSASRMKSGWSATVNGEPAQIEQVNVGFMAVRVPAGRTPSGLTMRRRASNWGPA